MANAGPKTNGSQFFITHTATPFLDGKHTVFGEVVRGLGVVDTIANVKTGVADKPVTDVVINEVNIIRNGKDARNFDAVQVITDYFAEEEAKAQALEKVKTDMGRELANQILKAEVQPSGLRTLVLKEGTGEKPKIGQSVLVNYAGYLMAAIIPMLPKPTVCIQPAGKKAALTNLYPWNTVQRHNSLPVLRKGCL